MREGGGVNEGWRREKGREGEREVSESPLLSGLRTPHSSLTHLTEFILSVFKTV